MLDQLKQKLYNHLVNYHPDILVSLEKERNVTNYLDEKIASISDLLQTHSQDKLPAYLIEDQCLQALTADLWPSRYQYLSEVLDTEFSSISEAWRQSGLKTYEIINLKEKCSEVFEAFEFNADTEEDRMLRYAIIGTIQDYLDEQ